MWETLRDAIDPVLGLSVDAKNLDVGQMACRAVVVFVFGVLLARFSDRRLLGQSAGFDIIILVILGSVLSRGINGEAAFFPTLLASVVLVVLHHVVASIALRSHWFSQLVKGRSRVLVRDGEIDRASLRRSKLTADDLDETLRLKGAQHASDVAEARLERNGSVSVVKAK